MCDAFLIWWRIPGSRRNRGCSNEPADGDRGRQKPDAERLKQLLKKAFENENISCSCFASGDEFLRAGWREGYQVVFLDICMEGTNGIETAQRLRAADPDLLIVFVTSSPEYVWDAFPVHPFDYLLKPYKEEKFEQLAGELRRVLCRQQPELEVRIARQIVWLPLTKIYYATAQNHYVRVVTDDGECRATANFAQVQEQLHTTELVLRKLGKQAVFVLLPHRQMGPIQHFNAVALKPQHLGHVDDHAAVAHLKFRRVLCRQQPELEVRLHWPLPVWAGPPCCWR